MATNSDWDALEDLENLTAEELEARIAAEEAALAETSDEDNGEEEPSLPSSLVAAVERLEIEKERLETKNAELVEVLLTGNAEEMVKLDSRSSAQATLQAALAAARSRNSKMSDLDNKAASLTKKLNEGKARLAMKQKGVDVCVLMDCTGSMGRHIEACKAKALEIMELAPKLHPDSITRLAFVGYRDFYGEAGDGHFVVHEFTEKENIGALRFNLQGVRASGGGNCEDVTGGLKKVTELSWSSSTRLLVHFGDMPCHGAQYNGGVPDTYPGGNPDGLVPVDLLKILCMNRIDYHFAKITSETNAMVEVFKGVYAQAHGAAAFEVHEYGSSAENFIPVMLQSISTSMRRSYARSASSSISSDGGYGMVVLPDVYNVLN